MKLKVFVIFLVTLGLFSPISSIGNNIGDLTNNNQYSLLGETIKDGLSVSEFYKLLPGINTFFGFETLFKRETTHNPLVFRQGGTYAPQVTPVSSAIPGPPFDIFTPVGVIPGCLNLLCPPPAGALWYAGVCWCTP